LQFQAIFATFCFLLPLRLLRSQVSGAKVMMLLMVPTLQAAQEQEIGIVKALIEGRADVNKARGGQPRRSGDPVNGTFF
jgi:hypothetical protein